jgi:hypothetical protein
MIATGDNGNDPIYARQYNGSPLSGTVNKQLTLLDASGNTFLAGDLTLGGNGYIYSTTDLALQLTGANVRTPGDLTVDGGDIIGTRPLQISTTDTFTTTGSSISGTTLTIGTLTSGTISVGMAITGGTTVNGTVITANISGSGSGSTWTVNTSQTVASSSITGAGNITLAPITAGSVALSLANGGNLTNNRNYVHGVIRNTTTANTNGDIWELNTSAAQSATNPYFRGLSLDNSADTTRGPATLLRSYSGGAVAGSGSRGRVIFEKARGTAASPTAVQSADVLGSVDVTGYTSTGWLNDTIPAITGTSTFAATENWVSNTNLGTNFNVALAPTATTIASGANLITVLSVSPQSAAHRSDATTFSQGKSGTTTYASLGLTGNTITALNASNVFVRQGTTTTTVPGLILRYSRTDQTGSSDLDGVDFRLSTAGTTTTNNISRIESQYRTSGLHEFGITVSSDNFVADTDTIYFAKADQTKIRTTPAGTTGTVSDTLTLTQLATTLKSDSLVLQTVAAAALPGDKISYGRQYIEAYSTVDQTNPVANAENLMAFENTGISNGISIVTNGTALTRITFANAGIYNLQFSAQLSQTSGGSANTFIWLKKNGANVANTAGDTRVAGNGDRIMAAWNYVFSAAAGDYYELAWSATDTSVILDYSAASAPVPAVPSVILTVVPVGA